MQRRIQTLIKAKDLTLTEIWLLWKFGRKVEHLEDVDFSWN